MAAVRDRAIDIEGRDNPVLLKLVAAIRAAYGPRIERIVLFGSRVRGDAEEDSDYDVAVFLHAIEDRMDEVIRLHDIERSVVRANDPVFDLIPLRAGSWSDRTTFMLDMRHEGLIL